LSPAEWGEFRKNDRCQTGRQKTRGFFW
jgi:hypothetical protein